jgi:hypothetical protein
MDVHSHSHHEGKKSWKSYIWEFLMLFFAVFCGFLAEWKLEHVIENQREREYMHSIVEDINEDINQTTMLIGRLKVQSVRLDSLTLELASPTIKQNYYKAFQLWSSSLGFRDFIHNDRTIQQLKSTGALRTIRIKAVSDSIMKYDQSARMIYVSQDVLNSVVLDQTLFYQMFDFINLKKNNANASPIPLTEKGKTSLNEAYANRLFWKLQIIGLTKRLTNINEEGKRLVKLIDIEYELGGK